MHFEVPTRDDDRMSIYCTFDGIDYYLLKAYWGDFGICYGWSGCWAYNGFDVTALAAGWPQGRVAGHVLDVTRRRTVAARARPAARA